MIALKDPANQLLRLKVLVSYFSTIFCEQRSDSKALALPQSHPKEAWGTPRPMDNLGYVYSSHNDPGELLFNMTPMMQKECE